jgi:hypothetical protein
MSEPRLDLAKIHPTYSGFLIDKVNKIYDAWDKGLLETALNRAMRLCYFLPKELKDKMRDDKNKIIEEFNKAYRVSGVDWYTRQQNRNRAARRVAHHYLPSFVDEMMNWLDERGYLEEKRRKIPEGSE